MAEAARGMRAAEIDQQHLPSPGTADELQELSDAFNGLLDRLREAFARQSRFTGDASHQLRTPLAAMIGQVDVALRRERPAEEYKRTLALVGEQAAHLSEIVEMLLFLARADAESPLPDCRVIDLAAWAREHVSGWCDYSGSRNFSVVVDGEGPWLVRAHGPLLAQLVDNLLDNAHNHTEPGTAVRLVLSRDLDSVAIGVEDDGPGIEAEDMPHVFDPFFRALRSRRQGRPGVGLGLAVAQRIAVSLHGTLIVRSVPGKGSAFRLTLPAAADDAPLDTEPAVPAASFGAV
jgi:signal transduction histidine kinase